jgi:imidazoleglycerol phosphate synthase cyclase subunit
MPVHPRLIPVLLLKNGVIVRSQLFKVHQVIGNPMSTVRRYSDWNADELVLLDISRGEDFHDLRRSDLQQSYAGTSALDVLAAVAEVCFMPVSINTAAFDDPDFVARAAARFGAQCVVLSIDAKLEADGRHMVYVDGGSRATGLEAAAWAQEVERLGAGEILLNAIHEDGSGRGYDLDLVRSVANAVSIPVVALGGVGDYAHFAPAVAEANASAAAAANIFHFFEVSYPLAKRAMRAAGVSVREPALGSRFLRREPDYNTPRETARLEERLRQARECDYPAARLDAARFRRPIRWCVRCTYPSISAAPMEFDADGLCTGCQMAEVKAAIPASEWSRRRGLLRDLVERYRCRDGSRHDVVVAVSGGKDSYFQVHVLKEEFGLNPLLVTYDGNNWTEPGWRNMVRMREAFGVDHLVSRSSFTANTDISTYAANSRWMTSRKSRIATVWNISRAATNGTTSSAVTVFPPPIWMSGSIQPTGKFSISTCAAYSSGTTSIGKLTSI